MKYIYQIECVPSGKKYIGKSGASFLNRWAAHIWQLRNMHTRIKNTLFAKEWILYPSLIHWRFSVLHEGDFTDKELSDLEVKCIADTPIEMRLNCPNRTTQTEERKRLICDLLISGMKLTDVAKEAKCALSYVHHYKQKLLFEGVYVRDHRLKKQL